MLVIAHRGASAAARENTLEAFRTAAHQGADGVELDVRRSADGTLAVHHDDVLPDGRSILGLTRAELPAEVPALDDALDACRPLRVVNVEIKNWPEDPDFDPDEQLADAVVARLRARGDLDSDRILVSSFHLPTVDRVRALAPGLATGWLLGPVEDPAALVERAAGHGHVAVHPHHAFVNERFVELAHGAGLAVNTWTCDDPDRIRWLADLGTDAVITNTPDIALAALGR
jgi:glycerophosphoryl diester phosphodiesterase